MQTGSLSQGQYPFDPTISLDAFGTLAPFVPQDTKADDALGEIVSGLHAFFNLEDDERVHVFLESTDKGNAVDLRESCHFDRREKSFRPRTIQRFLASLETTELPAGRLTQRH